MKALPIVWQRLLDDQGGTCPRCEATGAALRRALERLDAVFGPMGLRPELQTRTLDPAACRQAAQASNLILIAGRPLDEWLGGQPGSSPCCGACDGRTCRTLELDGHSYEAIPEELLVRAGITAGVRLLEANATSASPSERAGSCQPANSSGCCY